MSFFETLMNFISSLFGGNKPAQPAEQPKQEPQKPAAGNFALKMSDATFEFMAHSESEDMKKQLRAQMEQFERQGIYKYTIYSDKWEYIITDGQFRANPIKAKI